MSARALPAALGLLAAAALVACPSSGGGAPTRQVVVYCALDRLFAQPLLEEFERERGIEVLPKWDAEATKTTGLVEALRAERERPRCDVFWNNEVGQTVVLAREGLLQPHASPSAAGLPTEARDPGGLWTGFAARARVLIVNTDLVPEADTPRSVRDLLDPRWKGRCGVAKPLFGTTATHVAALVARDPEAARAWLAGLRANEVVVCAGNASVKDRVAAGELAFGLTDTDDVNLALLDGRPVKAVFPDQGQGEAGALLIPNSLALLRGAPHPEEGRALIDWLLRPEVEARLAASRSAQVPLREGVARPAWIPAGLRTFPVAWAAVGEAFPAARELARRELLGE
jgi:iron(III) transport system substrate-binding protein